MKTILLISIIYITYIICNNKHLKNKSNLLTDPDKQVCTDADGFGTLPATYTAVLYTANTPEYYIKTDKIAKVESADKKYTFYESEINGEFDTDASKYKFKLTPISTTIVDSTGSSPTVTGTTNYNYPWSKYTTPSINDVPIGFVKGDGGGYSTACKKENSGQKIDTNLHPSIKLKELPGDLDKYEQFDQYTESITEERKVITNDDVGLGKKLFKKSDSDFSYIYLHKDRFCYYTCNIPAQAADTVQCSLLAYPKSSNVKLEVNKAMYIKPDETSKPKYYHQIKATSTTADFKDSCADNTPDPLCEGSKFAFMSKKGTSTNYILNGYISTAAVGGKDKFAPKPAEANNEMPDDIKTKFSDFTYCFQDDNSVQSVTDIFINTLLLTIIILLMI